MPRAARAQSETRIFHVMQRGVDRQEIFFDDTDRLKFLAILGECKKVSGLELFAYCLMDNHIHLLLKAGEEELGASMRRLFSRYAGWYNLKYQRTGPLFQGRFRSEPVEDEVYFLAVFRYIHRNPVKAGLSQHPENYRWSSYFGYSGWPDGITDTAFAMGLFPGRSALLSFLNESADDTVADWPPVEKRRITDEEALGILEEICGRGGAQTFWQREQEARIGMSRQLIARGLSIRQLARLTGVPVTSLRRLLT